MVVVYGFRNPGLNHLLAKAEYVQDRKEEYEKMTPEHLNEIVSRYTQKGIIGRLFSDQEEKWNVEVAREILEERVPKA